VEQFGVVHQRHRNLSDGCYDVVEYHRVRHRHGVVVIDHRTWVAQGRDFIAQVNSVRRLYEPYVTRGAPGNTINRMRISRLMGEPGESR